MATLKNNNTPQFVLFPINNDRTAWKKFGLPVVLVVPHRKDLSGHQLANSKVRNIKIFIEDVPSQALVSGHQHIGKRFPDRELYRETVDSLELADRQIDIANSTITRNGIVISNADAENGDVLHHTTSTGIVDTILYLKHADYYDLSDFKIDVEILPNGIYNLVYEATYFPRKSAFGEVDQLLCIDTSYEAITQLRFKLNHPGDVIAEMHNLTPPVYLTTATKAEDTTLSFYRPFSDILQDIADEQALLERVNWVHDIVPEALPYLSQLLGWGVPYFPQSANTLRRAILRRTTHIQKLKGSSKAVHEIFRLFGFELLTQNLWWSDDGKRLIAPGEKLPSPYESLEIKKRTASQVDLLLNEWQTDGYGNFKIPLLFRPLQANGFDRFTALREGGNVTIDAYLVKKDSTAHLKLKTIAESIDSDPKGYGDSSGGHTTDNAGFLNPVQLRSELSGIETVGYSQVLLTGKLGESTDSVLTGTNIPLSDESCEYDRDDNILSLTFNGYKTFIKDKTVLYAFATYARDEFVIPSELADLQSNKFSIQVVTSELESRLLSIANQNAGEWDFHGAAVPNSAGLVSTTVLDFALDFLFKAKAFHSQLHVVKYAIDLTETYEVTDMCVGGDTAQRYDTPMGRLQVPPAIIPNIPADGPDCANSDPISLGYKSSDILLRLRKLSNLPEEHDAWKAYDDREIYQVGPTRLILPPSASGRTKCKYTHLGQDRITGSIFTVSSVEHNPNPNSNQGTRINSNLDLSPVDDITNGISEDTSGAASSNNNSELFSSFMKESNGIRDAHCDLDSITDFCYKGRVDDEILYRISNVNSETFRCKPCKIGMGFGAYWSYPTPTKRVIHGNDALCLRGIMNDGRGTLSVYSGGATKSGLIGHLESKPLGNITSKSFTSAHDAMLSSSYDKPLAKEHNSYLGRLYQNYDIPSSTTLHYHNRPSSPEGDQTLNLAFQRPGLDVQKETLHLPGCRFATMDSLKEDYTSISIKAKPWDDAFSTHCGPANLCADEPTYLNAKLIKDNDGDMMLSYSNQSYIVYKNGLEPDIPSLGSHALGTTDATFDSDDVVHEVYLDDAIGHPAITLDSVCAYDTSTAAIGSDELIETNTLMFDSGSVCELSSASYLDYAGGYPCIKGFVDYNDPDLGRSGLYTDLFTALGVENASNTATQVLFLLGSGIIIEKGIRMDCGCKVVECDGSESTTFCSTSLFLNDDSEYEWGCDHISVDNIAVLDETIGACSFRQNGELPSLLETI